MGESVTPIPTGDGCQGHPPTDQDPEAESGIKPALPNDTNRATSLPSKDPHPTSSLSIDTSLGTHAATNPAAWLLWSNGLPAYSSIRLVTTPGISSVSSSHIVKDKITGITYMDTITTSVGRVTISGPGLEAFPQVLQYRTSLITSRQPTENHHWVDKYSSFLWSKKEHS